MYVLNAIASLCVCICSELYAHPSFAASDADRQAKQIAWIEDVAHYAGTRAWIEDVAHYAGTRACMHARVGWLLTGERTLRPRRASRLCHRAAPVHGWSVVRR